MVPLATFPFSPVCQIPPGLKALSDSFDQKCLKVSKSCYSTFYQQLSTGPKSLIRAPLTDILDQKVTFLDTFNVILVNFMLKTFVSGPSESPFLLKSDH